MKYHHKKSRETWNLPRCRSPIDSILRLLLKITYRKACALMVSKNGVSKINQKIQNFEKHPKKSRFRVFFQKNQINENFQFGKKKSGCKKNSAVKKMSIPPPRLPTEICLQITIFFTCALTDTTYC